jgi:predicted MFS family arabinose efflux permease
MNNNKNIFAIIALISFLNAVSFTIIIPTLYPFALSFGLNDQQAGALLAIYAVSQFFATPVIGKLSDHYGRKPLLILSLAGSVVANLVASIAPSALILFLARLIDGITGGNSSVVQAVVSDISTPETRAKNFGIIGATFGTGFIVGPAMAILAQNYLKIPLVSSLGSAFALSSIMALIATIMTITLLPETNSKKDKPKQSTKLWQEIQKSINFKEMWTALSYPKLGLVFWLTILNGFAFTVFTFGYQPYFIKTLGRTPQDLAILFTGIGLVGLVGNFQLGKLVQKFGTLRTLQWAWIARGSILIATVAFADYRWFVLCSFLFALVNPIPMPLINTLISNNSNPDEQGKNAGLNSSYNSLSNALGPICAGLVLNFGLTLPFWLAGLLTLLLAIILHYKQHILD